MADKAILADALATAAVVLGMKGGLALLEGMPGVEGVIVNVDGDGVLDLMTTSGFASFRAAD